MEATETTDSPGAAGPEAADGRPGRYHRVKWVADYFDVGLSTIYEAIERGELPAVAIGLGRKRTLRVHHDDFIAYEQRCRVRPRTASSPGAPT
jgi:excisionase family DNA binding protein